MSPEAEGGQDSQPWRLLPRLLADGANVFVFPSEITARFWARRCLELGGCRTVTLDRFLSWDELKARLLLYPAEGRPMNRAARLLFLCRFLEDNRHTGRLRRLAPRVGDQAATSLAYLASLEPVLPTLHHAATLSWPEGSGAKRQDLLLLLREYSRHLQAVGRYEPAWERPTLRRDGRRYWLFWPELVEDYREFADVLQNSAWLRTLPVPPLPEGPLALHAHSTLAEELKAVLAEAAELLDSGVQAERIAITVGDLPEIEEALLRQAELYQVPLAIRHGRAATSFPVTRLFSRLFACLRSDMSLWALKALLLDRGIPWRQERLARQLVRLGVESKVLANREGTDAWLEALHRAGSDPALRSLPLGRLEGYYRSLEEAIRAATHSAGFGQLKDRLAVLAGEFLELARWSPEELEVYQFCLDSLDELEAEASACPPPASLPPWIIWLRHLESLRYVPRRPGGGIPVYPYRVAEGIRPEHHLLAGISQAATEHRLRRYPFLAIHEEQGLAEARVDLSAGHLRLYCHSGERVSLHYSRRRLGRTHLPPASLVAAGKLSGEPGWTEPPGEDPYEAETRAWAGAAPGRVERPLEAQARGFALARATVLQDRGLNVASAPLRDAALAERLFGRLAGEGGQLRLSATALERFAACPLRFLFERALDLGRETYEPVLEDAREVGRVLHGVVQRLFTALMEAGVDALTPAQARQCAELLRRAVSDELRLFEARNPGVLRPLWRALRARVQELAEAYLQRELSEMAGERTVQVEAWLQAPLPCGQAVLVGKVDRIAGSADPDRGLTLVEYKKNRLPARSEVFGPQPTSFQMPFYVHLVRAQGHTVSRALYYSFQKRHFRSFLRAGNQGDRLQLDAAVASVLDRLREMSERLRRGDYTTPGVGGAGCADCPFPALCRRRYVVGS